MYRAVSYEKCWGGCMNVVVDAYPAPRARQAVVGLPLYRVDARRQFVAGAWAHAIVREREWRPFVAQVQFIAGEWRLITHASLLAAPVQFLDDYGAVLLEFWPARI